MPGGLCCRLRRRFPIDGYRPRRRRRWSCCPSGVCPVRRMVLDPRRPRRGNGTQVTGREGRGPGGQVCARSRACWGEGPPNCLETSGLALARRECSSCSGEGQEAGRKSDATTRRGNPKRRSGSSEGPAWRQRREPGSTWLSGAATARQTPRSASKLRISRERDPPGASCWQIREPNALLKFSMRREGCEGTKKE